MKQSVTSVYFRVLAITDTTVLYSGGVVFFLVGAFGKDIRLYADWTCKFFIALLKVTCYHSCWILVLISIDRFIGVYIPHKYRQFCTKRRAVISIIILFFAIVAFVGGFWGVALSVSENKCGIGGDHLFFYNAVYQWLDLGVLNLIPSVILVSINVAIIWRISYGSFGADKEDSSSSSSKAKKQSNSLTVILLSISLVYILCTIPSSTAFLVIKTFHGARKASQVTLYVRSCETLYLANHASNFFLYCVNGTTFRKELKGLFCKSEKMTSSMSASTTNMSTYSVSQSEKNP